MGTSINTPIELFFRRIEKDSEFFNYFNLSDCESMQIAKERAFVYLEEAIGIVCLNCNPEVDFTERDKNGDFTFEWTQAEKLLIPSLMYEMYLDRDIAYLKNLNVNYTSSELKVFDPSNARSTFLALYQTVKAQNEYLLDRYKNTYRDTGEYKTLDFAVYDFSNEV